jgi:flavin reductase (DIM6/NTAB) family NADH-FMN oxidoreductase RutF
MPEDGMKKALPLDEATRLINPGPVVIVTASYKGRVNAMPAAWVVPLSKGPPLIGVSIQQSHLTHDLVVRSQQFAVSVPGRGIAEQVLRLGKLSGHDVDDKLALVGLHTMEAKEIDAPLIEEGLAWIECGVVDAFRVGDHTLFVGQVLAAMVQDQAFDEAWLLEEEELKPLHHLGGRLFSLLDSRIALK